MNDMKIIMIATLAMSLLSAQAARELPDYLPSAPSVNKELINYTVDDIMGCICTNWRKLPELHPFKAENGESKLKEEWPGSKTATNIDLFLNYLLLAPDSRDEKVLSDNLYWIIHEVMDVPNADKASAIVRVYSAQNDAEKKRKIATFSGKVFPYLLDIGLLTLVRDQLDDDTVLKTIRPEGAEPRVITQRGEAKTMCRNFLLGKGFLEVEMMGADYQNIFREATTEEESCKRLKQWMLNHWGGITVKVSEAIAKPNRSYRKPVIRMFEPRPND